MHLLLILPLATSPGLPRGPRLLLHRLPALLTPMHCTTRTIIADCGMVRLRNLLLLVALSLVEQVDASIASIGVIRSTVGHIAPLNVVAHHGGILLTQQTASRAHMKRGRLN